MDLLPFPRMPIQESPRNNRQRPQGTSGNVVNVRGMSSSHVARLMTRERRADDRVLEDGGTPRDGWFPRRVERHPPSSPITMKARGIRKDKAHDPALPARDLRRDRVGARSRRRALPVTRVRRVAWRFNRPFVRVGVAASSKNVVIISSWTNSRMMTKLPTVLDGKPDTRLMGVHGSEALGGQVQR
jgi:hypothetical protein